MQLREITTSYLVLDTRGLHKKMLQRINHQVVPPILTDGRIACALAGGGWMLDKDIGVSGGEDTSSAVSMLFGTSDGFEPRGVLKPLEGMEKLRGTV